LTPGTRFARASTALHLASDPGSDLCGPFIDALSVTGAVVTTLGDPIGTQTICASDSVAARIDEIQTDLGEGPCWEAHSSGRAVLEPDLQNSTRTTWPIAREALRETGIGSLHAFPLRFGQLRIGTVDLYSDEPRALTGPQIHDASALASIAARQVLRRAFLDIASGGPEMPGGEYSRREVHQASGMVSAQLGIGVDDALVLLRGHAFGNGRTLRETALDVTERRLDFSDPERGGN
jgi:hypothetical protein